MEDSIDLVNQIEREEIERNYDEYNQNNKLVNDIGYSYYLKNINNNISNNTIPVNTNYTNNNEGILYNNKSQTIDNSNYQKRRYNSQLFQLNKNLEKEFNNKSINQNNNNKIKNNLNYSELKIGGMSSTLDKTLNERERKKMLLDNIQTQITLRKKTKLEELKKRQEEDLNILKI